MIGSCQMNTKHKEMKWYPIEFIRPSIQKFINDTNEPMN